MAKQRRQANGVRVNNALAGAPYAVEGRGLAAKQAAAAAATAAPTTAAPTTAAPAPAAPTPAVNDPAGVGALANPLELPTIDAASAENARRLSVLKQRARGGRASTILSQPNY